MTGRFTEDELEEQFQMFLRQSASSEESFDALQKKASEITRVNKKNVVKPWWLDDDEKEEKIIGSGLSSSGKSFLKSKKSPDKEKTKSVTSMSSKKGKASGHAATKVKDKQEKPRTRKKEVSPKRSRSKAEASMSKDSLEDISEKSEENDAAEAARIRRLDSSADTTRDSCMTDHLESPDKPGMDTLDELADKQRFYHEVEGNGTIDYGQLNRDLSQTATTLSPGVAGRSGVTLNESRIPNLPSGSRDVEESEDVQHGGRESERDSSLQKPSMLSKVSLLDSLDSTLNTTTSPKASVPMDGSKEGFGQTQPDSLKTRTGTGMIGTNTSKEIEALHEALREVGMSPTIKLDDPLTGDIRGKEDSGIPDPNGPKGKSDRTVDDIFNEMGELERRVKAKENLDEDIQLHSDYHSPHSYSSSSHHSHGKGLSRQHHADDVLRHGGYDHSHTDDTEVYQPVTTVSVKEKKSDQLSDLHTTNTEIEEAKDKKSRSRFAHVQSSGYGKKSPSRSMSRSPIRSPGKQISGLSQNQTWSPAEVSRQKVKGTQSPRTARRDVSGTKVADTQLLQSVESFAGYIRDHFTGNGVPQVKYSEDEPSVSASIAIDYGTSVDKQLRSQLEEERQKNAKLREEAVSQSRAHQEAMDQLKVEHEQELFKLKQENFVLAARLNEGEIGSVARKKLVEVLGGDAVTREQLTMLEREIKEQESLIAGYQTENQRVYDEMKKIKSNTRTAEQKMFEENQRLVTEVTSLRSQLEQKEMALRNKGIITSLAAQQQIASGNADAEVTAGKVSQAEAELKQAMCRIDILQRELKVYQQTKFELDQHIHQLGQERDNIGVQLEDARKATPEQITELQQKHKEELDQLKRKIKWYTENQDMLDKNLNSLKKKDETIRELKLRLEGVTTEAGRKLEENKLRTRERAADAKRIQDLERQVKEMEQIIRRRHPNSIPALMMAAAATPDDTKATKLGSTQVLENRIKKLEDELGRKDDDANMLLRAMEQKYNNVKFKFEARIADLETQLSIYQRPPGASLDYLPTHMSVVERELCEVRDKYQKQVAGLQAEVDRLTALLTKGSGNQYSTIVNGSLSGSDLEQQVAMLQQELQMKKDDLHLLHTSMEKLRKEKELGTNVESSKKSKMKGKGSRKKLTNGVPQFASFPPRDLNGKSYEPETFADSDVTELLRENEELKIKMGSLQLELDQQRVDLHKSLAMTESMARKHHEDYEDQIESLRHSHKEDLQKVLSDQALQHSTSRLAQLHSKCDSQEVMIRHLQEQLSNSQADAEQISVLKIQQVAKQTQIEKLQDLLQEAKKNHTPEMHHFESLQEKIIQLENRHKQREAELKQIIANTQKVASHEYDQVVEKWRNIVESKNSEIRIFRAELDSILDVLRLLQRQGVVLPMGSMNR